MSRLKVTVGDATIRCERSDTPTAQALLEAAPFTARANTWGEEVDLTTPVSIEAEADAHDVVDAGELAFWPDGDVIAIGPTPISRAQEIRRAQRLQYLGSGAGRCDAAEGGPGRR